MNITFTDDIARRVCDHSCNTLSRKWTTWKINPIILEMINSFTINENNYGNDWFYKPMVNKAHKKQIHFKIYYCRNII